MIVMRYAVKFVFSEEVECHKSFREGRMRWARWKWDEGCQAKLKGGDFLSEKTVAAGERCHVGQFVLLNFANAMCCDGENGNILRPA